MLSLRAAWLLAVSVAAAWAQHPDQARRIAELRAALDQDRECAEPACRELAAMGAVAVPALIDALRNGNRNARSWAVNALHRIGPSAAGAVPALTDAYQRERAAANGHVSKYGPLWALQGIGPGAAPAVPVLIEAFATEEGLNSEMDTLRAIGPGAVPPLMAALADPRERVRRWSISGLSHVGPPAAVPAIPLMRRALEDPVAEVRFCAAESLGGMGRPASGAIPDLVALLDDEDERVRRSALNSLLPLGHLERESGITPWWVLPRVYWREVLGFAFGSAVWFAILARSRPTTTPRKAILAAAMAAPPTLVAAAASRHVCREEWAQPFIPELTLVVVPVPVAVGLSLGAVLLLISVWAAFRRPIRASP